MKFHEFPFQKALYILYHTELSAACRIFIVFLLLFSKLSARKYAQYLKWQRSHDTD